MSDQRYTATLVRAEKYVMARGHNGSEITFVRGIARVVSASIRDYLSTAAVDTVLGEVDEITGVREILHRERFYFEDYDGELGIGDLLEKVEVVKRQNVTPAAKPRTRTRKEA